MMNLVSKLHASREEGQTMAEYAVILGVITIAVVVTFGSFPPRSRTRSQRHRASSRPLASPLSGFPGGALTTPLRPPRAVTLP